jgi:hypothetical protein
MKRKFIWLFFAMLAVVALGNVALATSWSTGQYNFQRTGYNPTSSVDQYRLTQAWCYVHPSHLVFRDEPVELNGLVYVPFSSFTAAFNQVQALDINTGALLWTNTLPSTGNALRSTPTAATIDTTGLGDFADLVYVAKGSSGGGAGIRCIRGGVGGGTTKWDAATGAKRVRYARPVLADTDLNGTFDEVVVGDEFGQLWAFDPVTGALVWGPTVLDANYWIVFGPSLSTDNKVLYAGTWDFPGATGHGRVHAVDAATGAILGSFDPLTAALGEDYGFTAGAIYVDDTTVVALSYDVAGTGGVGGQALGLVFLLDRTATFIASSAVPLRYTGANWTMGAYYPDPILGEDLVIFAPENGVLTFGSPLLPRAFSLDRVRAGVAARIWNATACTAIDVLGESPVAVANSPDGNGVVAVNSDGGQAGADAKLYILPAHSGNPNFGYWNKTYNMSHTYGVLQQAGVIFSDGANDSGIVMVASEGFGAVYGFRNNASARARWTDESGCQATVLLNVPLPFNGTYTDTLTYYNIGDGAGSYTGPTIAAASAASLPGMSISKTELKPRMTSSAREKFADDMVDAVTVTPKSKFMSRTTSMVRSLELEEQFPEMAVKAGYSNKQKETPTSASFPVWLSVTDLNGGGGPIAAGGSFDVELVASSATLPLGTYFYDLTLTVTPDDPDPMLGNAATFGCGGTDFVVPITFIVGFVPENGYVDASDAALEISNWGNLGVSQNGFLWDGAPAANFFGGGFGIITQDTVFTGMYGYDRGLFVADGILNFNTVLNPSPYVAEAHTCSTAYVTVGGAGACSLRVQQYTIGLWDGAFCDSMIIQKHVITNVGVNACTLAAVTFIDWDLNGGTDNLGDADAARQMMWLYNDGDSTRIFGMMRKPSDDLKSWGFLIDNATSIYNATNTDGSRPDDDSLRNWAATTPAGTYDLSMNITGPADHSTIVGTSGIVLAPGESHLEEYIIFGWDLTDVPLDQYVWKTWLRQEGFYRGDVNTDNRGHERSTAGVDLGAAPNGGSINVIDIVYLANYYLKGTNSPWPFTDQGDVNCDGVVSLVDVIYLANFVFKKGPAPIDKNRFLPPSYQALFSRTSISLLPAYK